MQVTRETFPAVFPRFKELLETCEFYALDEEMTGINVPEVMQSIEFSSEDSYHAKRLAASRYSVIQVGVCLFHRKTADSTLAYEARPFNFLLFPSDTDDATEEERGGDVVVSPTSLAFLRRHGMDFQRWVYHGIPFCDGRREAALRARLSAASKKPTATVTLLSVAEKEWVEESIKAARSLVERAATAGAVDNKSAKMPVVKMEVVDMEVVLKPQSSRAAREYLETEIAAEYTQLTLRSRRSGPKLFTITLSIHTAEELQKREVKAARVQQRRLMDTVGFRLVFQALVASRKPCVGHNCFADMLFLMKALDGPLSEKLVGWKERAQELFPCVMDTRYIAGRQDLFPRGRFASLHLGGLYEAYAFTSPHCTVELPLGFELYDPLTLLGVTGTFSGGGTRDPSHEAGYDALMTGTVLLNLLAEAGGHTVLSAPADLRNKLAIFHSLYAVNLCNAGGDEFLPEAVVELQHADTVKPHHLESAVASVVGPGEVSLYAIGPQRSLVVLPQGSQALKQVTVESLIARLSTICPTLFTAHPFTVPHLRMNAATAPQRTGVMHCTPRRLMRALALRR